MPRIIELSTRPIDGFVTPTSRYAQSTVLNYSEQNLLTFDIYKRSVNVASETDKFTVVTPGTEFRPDIISQRAYGVPDFWWKIMEANKIFDIFDFRSGLNIRLPGNVF